MRYEDHPHYDRFRFAHLEVAGKARREMESRLLSRLMGETPEVSRKLARDYFGALAPDLVRDHGGKGYAVFEKGALDRIGLIGSLRAHAPALLRDRLDDLYKSQPSRSSFPSKVKGLRLSLEHAHRWGRLKDRSVSGLSLRPEFLVHGEAPFALSIYHPDEGRVASAGFRLDIDSKGSPVLSITNVQGEAGKEEALAGVTKALSRNWRVHLVGELVDYAKRNGFAVTAVFPARKVILGRPKEGATNASIQSEYRRLVGQYSRTYLHAGLVVKGKRGNVYALPAEEKKVIERPRVSTYGRY